MFLHSGLQLLVTADVRFEVFMAMTMKVVVFWDVITRATQHNNPEDDIFTANVVPSSLILSILMMEAIHSSKTSVLKRAT
jgi:hypothetical protein